MPIGPARLYHVNVNCRYLDICLGYYTGSLGLTTTVRTTVEPQPCTSLGLEVGAWDAWILADAAPFGEGAVLDLLEWKTPLPVGLPAQPGQLGYTTLIFTSPTSKPGIFANPEYVAEERRDGDAVRFAGVKVGVRDLDAARSWWTEIVGLEAGGPDGCVLSDHRGPGAFAVELVAAPDAPDPGPPVANRVGAYRMALLTDSIADDHAFLQERGVRCLSGVETLEMGGGLPTLQVLCFLDPDGTVIELIESPV